MNPRHLSMLGLALFVGGCAAAVPGYKPPNPKLEKFQAAAPQGGGFDARGTYSLSNQEQELGCKQLTGSIKIKILQMRSASSRVPPSTAAALAQGAVRPVVGGTRYGQDLDQDLQRDRARLETLNRRLAEKNCPTYDLATELRPGNTARPQPVKPAGKR